jgi:hypothetical protein
MYNDFIDKKQMKANTYLILERAVQEGALMGYRRAFKYVQDPSEEAIVEAIVDGVMLTVSEVFVFDDVKGESYD